MGISQKVGAVWIWFCYQIKTERLKVCSLQWYQNLILTKISLVSCFVEVHHKFKRKEYFAEVRNFQTAVIFFFFFFFFFFLLVWITNLPSILLCLLISGILTNLYIINFKTCRRLLYLSTKFIICIGQPCPSLPTVHITVSDCSHTYL